VQWLKNAYIYMCVCVYIFNSVNSKQIHDTNNNKWIGGKLEMTLRFYYDYCKFQGLLIFKWIKNLNNRRKVHIKLLKL